MLPTLVQMISKFPRNFDIFIKIGCALEDPRQRDFKFEPPFGWFKFKVSSFRVDPSFTKISKFLRNFDIILDHINENLRFSLILALEQIDYPSRSDKFACEFICRTNDPRNLLEIRYHRPY